MEVLAFFSVTDIAIITHRSIIHVNKLVLSSPSKQAHLRDDPQFACDPLDYRFAHSANVTLVNQNQPVPKAKSDI
jgi:hypothetical protein